MPHLSVKHLQPEIPDAVLDTEQQTRVLFENFTLLKSSVLGHNVDIANTTVVNTTTETTVFADLISEHSVSFGEILKLALYATYSNATASDDFTIRVKIGTTTLATINRLGGNKSDVGFLAEAILFITAVGAAGGVKDFVLITDDDATYAQGEAIEHSIDFAVDQQLTVTFQWDNAKAGNTITFFAATLSHMHKED